MSPPSPIPGPFSVLVVPEGVTVFVEWYSPVFPHGLLLLVVLRWRLMIALRVPINNEQRFLGPLEPQLASPNRKPFSDQTDLEWRQSLFACLSGWHENTRGRSLLIEKRIRVAFNVGQPHWSLRRAGSHRPVVDLVIYNPLRGAPALSV